VSNDSSLFKNAGTGDLEETVHIHKLTPGCHQETLKMAIWQGPFNSGTAGLTASGTKTERDKCGMVQGLTNLRTPMVRRSAV
jgi:hypothetical protein